MKTIRCEFCKRRMYTEKQKSAHEQDCDLPRLCFGDMLEALYAWQVAEDDLSSDTLRYARRVRDAALRKIKSGRRKV